jgi:energy-coupling factor transporter ATP-binding protein EcfA2
MSLELMPDKDVIEKSAKLKSVKFWASRFNFLNEHNGIRPGKIHYLMGTTGTGKSTLAASIIADAAMDSPVLVIVSEESIEDYANRIYLTKQDVPKENIQFVYERNMNEAIKSDQDKVWAWLEMRIIEAGARLVFWDNLTSSPYFSQRFGPSGQEMAVSKIVEFGLKNKVAFFILMHTAKNVTDNFGKFIEGEDVRGTQQSFIGADFFYIFQRFSVKDQYFPFIRTVKHRGFNPKRIHLLYFQNGVYLKDSPSDFEAMNNIFMKRNVLGKFIKTEKGSKRDF